MKEWTINYSDEAQRDLEDIIDYISLILLEHETALKQSNRIMDAVDSLNYMPFRYRLYEREPWYSKGLRILPVDNYLVFYYPDEKKGVVNIIRIIHGRRDIDKHI